MEEMRAGKDLLRDETQGADLNGSLDERSIMQYSEGNLGRIFVLRMDDGEDLIASLQRFVADKKVQSGMALFMGALKEGRMVTGPEQPVIPPVPHWDSFQGGWEVFGMATIYPSSTGSKIHIHSGMGKGKDAKLGCIREQAEVYLIIEAVLFEFSGLNASREFDGRTNSYLLSLEKSL
jgi:predicted DNA-binding protein with PD1-like motif